MMGKRLVIALLSVLISNYSAGQTGFSMEAYLRTAMEDQSLEMYNAQLDFLKNNKFSKPWLSRVELRLGTENSDVSTINDYSLRISPSNPSEIRANKLYHQKQIDHVNASYRVALNLALYNRYLLLIDHYYYASLADIYAEWRQQTSQLATLLTEGRLENIDMGDMLDLESDISEAELKLNESRTEKAEIEFFMALDLPSAANATWREGDFAGIERIKRFVTERRPGDTEQNAYVLEAEKNAALEEQMYRISRAESWDNMGFFETEFDSERGEGMHEHLGFQIGVRLPIFNPDKPDLRRDQFDLIEEHSEIDATKTLSERRSGQLLVRLNHLFDRHSLLEERLDAAMNMRIAPPVEDDLEVMDFMDQKSYQADLKEKKLETEREIYLAFIEYLEANGLLSADPLINYLSFKAIE